MSIGARERRPGGRERRPRRKLRLHLPVFLLVLGAILLVAALRLWIPFSNARRQQDEVARLRQQKAGLAAERAQLDEYKHRLASDQGLEASARQEGYVKRGERRLVFVRQKPGAKKTPAKK